MPLMSNVSHQMPSAIATRGPKFGQCNMCGESGLLTEDHTPPMGCYRPGQVEIQSLVRRVSQTHPSKKSRFSQNGVKYRTLCHRCNNTLLGANYDPPFNDFVRQASAILRSTLILPRVVSVPGQPQAIMRSLLGHLSAQGVQRYRKGPHTEALRAYMLDTSLPLPAPLRVFYWLYPHQSHVMARDAAYVDLGVGNPFAVWLLKFYPIAFMVTWDGPETLPFPAESFDEWRSVGYSVNADIPIRLNPLPPEYWPEAPTDHSVLAFGREAISVMANSSVKGTSRKRAAPYVER
jgi:hypothetical protein